MPIELIFNEGPNDLFVIRVAGNGLGTEVLGSLKYAVEQLGGTLKLIVVLGHSGCGALTTAVDVFLNPANYLAIATKHSLRNILDHSLVVVQASANKLLTAFGPDIARHPGYRQALIEASIVTNAALAAYSIQQEFVANELTARGLRRLPSRDPRGMGTAPRQHPGSRFGRRAHGTTPDLPTSATRSFSPAALRRISNRKHSGFTNCARSRHSGPAPRARPRLRSYSLQIRISGKAPTSGRSRAIPPQPIAEARSLARSI